MKAMEKTKYKLYSFIIRRYSISQVIILFLWYVILFKLFGVASVTYCEGWSFPGEWLRPTMHALYPDQFTAEAPKEFPLEVATREVLSSGFACDLPNMQAEVHLMVQKFYNHPKNRNFIETFADIVPSKDHAMFKPHLKEALDAELRNEFLDFYYVNCHKKHDVDPNLILNLMTSFNFYAASMDTNEVVKFISDDLYTKMFRHIEDDVRDHCQKMDLSEMIKNLNTCVNSRV